MKPYIPSKVMTSFFSTSAPEEIFCALHDYFKSISTCTTTLSDSHYKIKAEITSPTDKLCIKANITSAGDQRAVTLTKTTGHVMELMKVYKALLEKYPFLPDGASTSN